MSEYMAQLQETDNSSKKQFNELGEKIHELSNGIIGLSSSIRHTQEEQLKAARSSAKSLTDVQWQLSGVGKSVNTSTKESLLSIGKVLSQLGTSVEKQGKSMDKTNLLLENLCSTMKTLVDVEQRKSTLVAQVSQAAKAAPMTGTTSAPASVPGVSPPGSAPGGFVTNPTTDGAPQATLGTGNVASPPGAEVDADQFDAANAIRVSSGTGLYASELCPTCGTSHLHDSIDPRDIWMLLWIRRTTTSLLETRSFGRWIVGLG